MFIACCLLCIGFSLTAPAPSEAQIAGLTFGTLTPEQKAKDKNSYGVLDIAASVLLAVIVISILSYFTG